MVNEFCRKCPKCSKVFEYDYDYDDEQLKENRGRIFFIANPMTKFHLKFFFQKWNINKMFSSSEFDSLSNIIVQFKGMTGISQ